MNQDIRRLGGPGLPSPTARERICARAIIGITQMRKRFFDDLEKVAAGKDPSGILRDPAAAACVPLPDVMRKYNVEGVPLSDYDKHPLLRERLAGFRHHYGQPADVRRAFAKAMGIAG